MELTYGDLVKINNKALKIENLTGVVLAHDTATNTVFYRIIANDFVGKTTYKVDRWCCTVIGRYDKTITI